MLSHADRYSQAFSKDAKEMTIKGKKKKKVSFADFEAGNYPKEDEWMYSSFWYKDFDKMAKKTMIRRLIGEWGIMSIEMQRAYEGDMAEIREDGANSYIDNQPEEENAEDAYVDATVFDGAEDAFAEREMDGQQQLDLGGGADEVK